MNDFNSGEYLTIREAADVIPHASQQALLRWIHSGKMPVVELPSGRKLIRKQDIASMLEPRFIKKEDSRTS